MRPVGVGMLGCGFIGEFHALGLRYVPDARVVAGCDANADRRGTFAARFGSRPFETIEELCADPEVDLVVVSLPNHLHREAVLAAAAAGKAVACTKPLGRNAAEAADMLRAVKEAGVWSAYLENVVFNLDIMRMRQMIEAGSIGRVTTVRAREGHSGPHARTLDAGWPRRRAPGHGLHGTEVARYCSARTLPPARCSLGRNARPRGAGPRRGQSRHGHRFEDGRAGQVRSSVVSRGGLRVA